MTPKQLLRRVFPPMLASLAESPPRDATTWSYELKYDGYRAICAIVDGEHAMLSRNELDLSQRFSRTFAALQKIKAKEIVLDGEVVVVDEHGTPRFQLLQQGGEERLILFDVLWMDGKDLRKLTYVERRAILEKLCKKTPAGIEVSQQLTLSGDAALAHAAKAGFEGIIAKKNSSVYESRRSKEWLKIKAIQQQELIVIGYQPSNHSSLEIGALHLAVYEDSELRYSGRVGTGFSAKQRVWFQKELSKDVIPKSPAADAPRERDATWVRPRFVAQVAFTEWTSDHRLRHPSFLGLREDKSVKEVVKEEPVATPKPRGRATAHPRERASARPTVTFTNPDRLLYPRDRILKRDIAEYYEALSGPLLKALRDRPLSLEHWNQGIDKPSWFHQHLGKEAPSWLTTIDTPARVSERGTVKHLIADSVESLRWLAQMSVLTIHMWSSRSQNLEEPDWILFDLDPAKGKGIEQAIEAAIVMRGLLENLELPSMPKTSGKRGIHVFVPIAAGYSHEQVVEFACAIGAAVAGQVPGITVERSLAKRRGRLYLDCLQNGYGKTVVAPYSPRAIDGAPVSAPLEWSEVTKKLDPKKFNIKTMANRVAKKGDLFAKMFAKKAKLPVLSR
ncbi:MAG TPA: DNA ligase D [Thermoanaerobaculia bacterium]|nr:DNA ligase D [Thermoanaerobaculia bacterium]